MNALMNPFPISPGVAPSTLAQAPMSQDDADRKRQMKVAWTAYHGELPKPLKIANDQPDDNVMSNRIAPMINKIVSFLFGQVLKIEPSRQSLGFDQSDSAVDVMEALDKQGYAAFIEGLWGDDDKRMTLLSQAAINGGVCGHVFLKLIPPQGKMKYPRIIVMNPENIRIVSDPDDCTLVLAYIIEYPVSGDFQKKQIIARVDPDKLASIAGEYDLDDTWQIRTYLRKGPMGNWFQVGETQDWPYPFAPIFECQNLPNPNELWGIPDATKDLIEQNIVLNFVQSNISRILKYHAHPKTYATGVQASQISVAIDDVLCLPTPESKLANLEMKSDLASSMNFAANIRLDMDEQSRVPAVALGRSAELPKGNLSGVALQLLFQPLIEKTIQKQRLYGSLIRDITKAAMVLCGMISLEEYESFVIELHWQNLLPVDDLAAAQTGLVLKELGVSLHTILQSLGYNPADEASKREQDIQLNPQVQQKESQAASMSTQQGE